MASRKKVHRGAKNPTQKQPVIPKSTPPAKPVPKIKLKAKPIPKPVEKAAEPIVEDTEEAAIGLDGEIDTIDAVIKEEPPALKPASKASKSKAVERDESVEIVEVKKRKQQLVAFEFYLLLDNKPIKNRPRSIDVLNSAEYWQYSEHRV
jgi:hypothetical protein